MRNRGWIAAAIVLALTVVALPAQAEPETLPPETPECNNGHRIRACVHLQFDSASADNSAAVCAFHAAADFVFDDPFFATTAAGDFSWDWGWTIKDGLDLIDSNADSGDFAGVPLYPRFGLVSTPVQDIEFFSGETFKMMAHAVDSHPVALEDEVWAYFELTCP